MGTARRPYPEERSDGPAAGAWRRSAGFHLAGCGRQSGEPVVLPWPASDRLLLPGGHDSGLHQEACDFRDHLADLSSSDTAVLGISPDKPEKLAKFREKESLTFPLLSDPDHAVEQAYGAYGEKMMYGRKSVGVIRSTFVIDPDGKVAQAYYGVKATGHVDRLLKELATG